jgi:hypothetical protein
MQIFNAVHSPSHLCGNLELHILCIGMVPFNNSHILFCRREGQSDLSWDAARSYCQRKGMRMISFDSQDKVQHFFGIISSENTPFIWAGATKSG